MIAASPDIEFYRSHFNQLQDERGSEPAWLVNLRTEALARFEEIGFPTTQHEEWKYTSVQPIVETAFQSPQARSEMTPACVTKTFGEARVRLVFMNGHYAPEMSNLDSLPKGVTVTNLASAISSHSEIIEPYLGRMAKFRDQAFVALNSSLFQDGVFVHLARNVVFEEPIQILFLTDATKGAFAAHPRNLYIAEENSQATIVETYWGAENEIYFTNAVSEIVLAERAYLDHYKVQTEGPDAFHIATLQIDQKADSVFSNHNISFGGRIVRNDINARLGGEHIESTVNGLYVVDGRQHMDTHTAIDHAMPNCNSHELYKGIMDGKSTGVFNGKIFVREDAQKTDAKQTNQNLLLSPDATVDTKPQLEIFADDVKCTHGATIGQLDADAMFYLRARGIGESEARAMLVHAFASDLLNRIKLTDLRENLESKLMEKLNDGISN